MGTSEGLSEHITRHRREQETIMVTNMEIREALLNGMDADTVRLIPENDIELIRKALVPEADVEGLPAFLFSDGARQAITSENLEQLTELSREHFAKAMPPGMMGQPPQEDGKPDKPKPSKGKLRRMAEAAFGTKPDDDEDEDDLDEERDLDEDEMDDDDYGDEGEDWDEDVPPAMLPPNTAKRAKVDALKKALEEAEADLYYEGDGDGDEGEVVVDAGELLEPIAKALSVRDESLQGLLQEVLQENRDVRAEIRSLRKGLIKVTDALERIEPIQKAFAGFMGNQAFPAGRPPSGMVVAPQQGTDDFDMPRGEFEAVLQKGLAFGLIDAGMSSTLRDHYGTPNMALHHQTVTNLAQSVKSMEERARHQNGG